MCVFYGFAMGGLGLLAIHGKVQPKSASRFAARFTAIWLPICLVAVAIRTFVDIGWLAAGIIVPFAVLGAWLGISLWRLERAVSRQ